MDKTKVSISHTIFAAENFSLPHAALAAITPIQFMTSTPNQFTGYRSPGFRFRFHVRSIARPVLFIPLEMKSIPQIRHLINGESPLSVFNTDSIHTARKAFCELRKKFDFSFWAITEYYVRRRDNADEIVPLKLNTSQQYIVDILSKRYYNRQPGRYVITKTAFPCGLTTCVQAYITWMQTYRCTNNSYTCSSSEINLNPLKTNLCRWLKRDIVPPEKWIFLPRTGDRAFFNTMKNPDSGRGINFGYVHLADMGKWKDPSGLTTLRTVNAAVSGVLLDYFTLVIYEGNIPDGDRFQLWRYHDFSVPSGERIAELAKISKNPRFLYQVALASAPDSTSDILHIDLDDSYFAYRRVKIPLRT